MSGITNLFPNKSANNGRPPKTTQAGIVTIVMNGNALFTRKPTEKDVDLFAQMQHARQKWVSEGKPKSGK